jgi:hypothetical protein
LLFKQKGHTKGLTALHIMATVASTARPLWSQELANQARAANAFLKIGYDKAGLPVKKGGTLTLGGAEKKWNADPLTNHRAAVDRTYVYLDEWRIAGPEAAVAGFLQRYGLNQAQIQGALANAIRNASDPRYLAVKQQPRVHVQVKPELYKHYLVLGKKKAEGVAAGGKHRASSPRDFNAKYQQVQAQNKYLNIKGLQLSAKGGKPTGLKVVDHVPRGYTVVPGTRLVANDPGQVDRAAQFFPGLGINTARGAQVALPQAGVVAQAGLVALPQAVQTGLVAFPQAGLVSLPVALPQAGLVSLPAAVPVALPATAPLPVALPQAVSTRPPSAGRPRSTAGSPRGSAQVSLPQIPGQVAGLPQLPQFPGLGQV